MPKRRWYRSLYSKIAIGYVVLLATLLLVQTSLAVWMSGQLWGRANRTPAQVADVVAQDLETQLSEYPGLDLAAHLKAKYGRGYPPFAVVFGSREEVFSNRPNVLPPPLGREARRRLYHQGEPFEHEPPPNGRRFYAEYADVTVGGRIIGVVAVPRNPPGFDISFREIAPTLAWIGVALLGFGAAIMAFVIFRPTRRRLHSLEEAARALGEGRTDVRADEAGGDEVSALAGTFNTMATDLSTRATALAESDRVRRQLLADVSHELMTPLAGIRGYIETLAMPELTLDEPTKRRYLGIVDEETHKLESIIGDLLDLARLEGGGDTLEREPVLIDDLFRRVADRHQPQLRDRGVSLTTTTEAGTPLVFGDPDRLEQALQNVAANAIRHTPAGGTVTLRAQPDGDRVQLTISDTGPGIPRDHLTHVFDRFYKVDAARSGTGAPSGSGLGLSIVRAIVNRHGGEVHASNTPGGGAVFTFLLPAVSVSR
ncbi:MAG TPA: HAMP domain-containing sensor histidine kinase [Vicinamibacterales bacterium]|jgi:signal transduction histidine kinase